MTWAECRPFPVLQGIIAIALKASIAEIVELLYVGQMKSLIGGTVVIASTPALQKTRKFIAWPNNGTLIAIGLDVLPGGFANVTVKWQLKDTNQWTYSYGPWPDANASALRDALEFGTPYAGYIGGEAYNFLIRGFLVSKV